MITAHTLVKNEERFLWFAVTSVIDHVDKVLLWDTGSTDNTIQIINELKKKYPRKIDIKIFRDVNAETYTLLRQKMLKETKSDWILIVDGDEVWWDEKIAETTKLMRKKMYLETIVSQYFNIIGDIYHYQSLKDSLYRIDSRTGPYTIRAMSKKNIKGLFTSKPHGQHGYFDQDGVLVQERDGSKRNWIEGASYLHFSNMIRSGNREFDLLVAKRSSKFKHELGKEFPLDFIYPEAFFKPRPSIVPNPWVKMSRKYYLRSLAETPLRKIKRKLVKSGSGY